MLRLGGGGQALKNTCIVSSSAGPQRRQTGRTIPQLTGRKRRPPFRLPLITPRRPVSVLAAVLALAEPSSTTCGSNCLAVMGDDGADDLLVNNVTPFLSWSGTFGATVAVLITTLDDSVWLVSFVGSSNLDSKARWVHAVTFLASLLALSIVCCVIAVAIETGVSASIDSEHLEIILEAIAATICWSLAIFIFVKKLLKRRRKRLQKEQEEEQQAATVKRCSVNYGAVAQGDEVEELPKQDEGNNDDDRRAPTSSQPCTVVSLTTIGFLDEMSYFPTLIIGGVFTPWELFVATLFAGLIMLAIQVFLATQFKPLIDFLDDHVPLYGIITVFAVVLTLSLVWDLVTMERDG